MLLKARTNSFNNMKIQDNHTNAQNEPTTISTGGDSEFCKWGKELERLAQAGVNKEIANHIAAGRSIFYSRQGVLIMELADGRCFEYRHLEDGTREIIRELPEWTKTLLL